MNQETTIRDLAAAAFDYGVERMNARRELRPGQLPELLATAEAFRAGVPMTEEQVFDFRFYAGRGLREGSGLLSDATIDRVFDFLSSMGWGDL